MIKLCKAIDETAVLQDKRTISCINDPSEEVLMFEIPIHVTIVDHRKL